MSLLLRLLGAGGGTDATIVGATGSATAAGSTGLLTVTEVGSTGEATAAGTASAFNITEVGATASATAAGSTSAFTVTEVGQVGAATAAGGQGLLDVLLRGDAAAAAADGSAASISGVDGGGVDATITGDTGSAAADGGTGSIVAVDTPLMPPGGGGRYERDYGDESDYERWVVSARIVGHTGRAAASGGQGFIRARSRVVLPPRARDALVAGAGGDAIADGVTATFRTTSVVPVGAGAASARGGTATIRRVDGPDEWLVLSEFFGML
jgi:hypothetical protein